QGRILLSRPLSQFSGVGVGTLTRDRPLSGFEQRLLVDYEWVPRGFDADQLAAGARAKQWLGENVAVGGTWVQERRAGDDYRLQGVDLTWQAGRGTVVKLEHSRSESTGTPVFVSDNGGFDFVQTNAGIGHREGEASALELQANFKEIGWTERNASLRAWSRQVDAGYSVARNDSGLATREHGAQLRGEL